MIDIKFDMRVKDIKNLQANDWIFKICSHINFLVEANAKTKFRAKFLTNVGYMRKKEQILR